MDIQIRQAATPAEREAVYRLRYQVYVEELEDRELESEDSGQKAVIDADDETARLFGGFVAGRLAGTIRLKGGGDGPFSPELIATYSLRPFLDLMGPQHVFVYGRLAVLPEQRCAGLGFQLMLHSARVAIENGAEAVFLDCQPHLIEVYQKLGFRSYRKTYNDRSGGILIPMVILRSDFEFLEKIGSPLIPLVKLRPPTDKLPRLRKLVAKLSEEAALRSVPPDQDPEAVQELFACVHENQPSLLHGLGEEDVRMLLARTHRISCSRGDALIRKDRPTRTLYVVLSGTLEVRIGDATVAYLQRGECAGELAFLHGFRRTRDVFAATENVEVASFEREAFDRLLESAPKLAARFLLNMTKTLSLRLIRATEDHR
jgi:predicted GNAT family N-acyltransferase